MNENIIKAEVFNLNPRPIKDVYKAWKRVKIEYPNVLVFMGCERELTIVIFNEDVDLLSNYYLTDPMQEKGFQYFGFSFLSLEEYSEFLTELVDNKMEFNIANYLC